MNANKAHLKKELCNLKEEVVCLRKVNQGDEGFYYDCLVCGLDQILDSK